MSFSPRFCHNLKRSFCCAFVRLQRSPENQDPQGQGGPFEGGAFPKVLLMC